MKTTGWEDKEAFKRITESLEAVEKEMQHAVKEAGLEVWDKMVENVSGASVSWNGGAFQIGTVTGNLRRRTRMEYPHEGNPYAVSIYNSAQYAELIEKGVTGEQRKQGLLQGAPVSKAGTPYRRVPARGKRGRTSFFTVTDKSTLKDTPPRPFIEATLQQMKERVKELLGNVLMERFGGGGGR